MTGGPRVPREQRNTVIRNRAALFLSAVFQPPVTVAVLLLLSPVIEPGYPGTAWFGALAVLFVCVLPFAVVLLLVRLGKITDHHVSDSRQRAPVMAMALLSLLAGLGLLTAVDAPASVIVMVLAIVGSVVVLGAISVVWKISGHAGAVALSTAIAVLMLGAPWIPLMLLIPAVGWSRVVLRAHTAAQVVMGALVGGGVAAGLWLLLREAMVRAG